MKGWHKMKNDRLFDLVNEYKTLYNINEAESILLVQLAQLVSMLGYSPRLTVKLLKTLSAIWEVLVDEMDKAKAEKK